MKYDLGVIVPVCGRFKERLEDFKRYGLVNIKDRKVLVNLILSNETLEGLDSGWDRNISVNVVKSDCPNHVSNIYKFYAQMDPENIDCRWLARVDDDSCTDIDGLISNLDEFYEWTGDFYLGASLQNFSVVLDGNEGELYPEYSHILENYKRISRALKNEVECGILSAAALKKILSNKPSLDLLKFRTRLHGGYGDCVLAIASSMAKIYPVDCPFLTHLPILSDFSMVGGNLNHIHLISRHSEGENFYWERATDDQFILLTKIVDGVVSELERSLVGSKFLLETDDSLKTYEFRDKHMIRAKFESNPFMWMEHEGFVYVFNGNEMIHKLTIDAEGDLRGGRVTLKKI